MIHARPELAIQDFIPYLCSIRNHLSGSKIGLAIENTPTTTPVYLNDLFTQLRNTDTQHGAGIGVCLDIGHANLCPATPNDYCGFLAQLSTEIPILHAHFHRNAGDTDSHLPLFPDSMKTTFSLSSHSDTTGLAHLITQLCARHFHGMIILEQWPSPPELLVTGRKNLQLLYMDKQGGWIRSR